MYFTVTQVTPLKQLYASLEFKNGEKKVFDMRPCLENMHIKEVKDENIFKTAK